MRVAVFVDAGYVFAQGSTTITGLKTPKPRDQLEMKEEAIVRLLKSAALASSNGKELLRIYWYDGAPQSGPSPEQTRLAHLGDVKLRLGFLNSEGQQKGVDSLIVTDLMELARNKAISDAVVVTGDDDIRVGLQIAQSHGVRVHVLGMAGPPSRSTQSSLLLQEADTVEIWGKAEINSFMRIKAPKEPDDKPREKRATPSAAVSDPPKPPRAERKSATAALDELVQSVHKHFAAEPKKILKAAKIVKDGKEVPGELVKVLNGKLEIQLKRKPTWTERTEARKALAIKLKEVP